MDKYDRLASFYNAELETFAAQSTKLQNPGYFLNAHNFIYREVETARINQQTTSKTALVIEDYLHTNFDYPAFSKR